MISLQLLWIATNPFFWVVLGILLVSYLLWGLPGRETMIRYWSLYGVLICLFCLASFHVIFEYTQLETLNGIRFDLRVKLERDRQSNPGLYWNDPVPLMDHVYVGKALPEDAFIISIDDQPTSQGDRHWGSEDIMTFLRQSWRTIVDLEKIPDQTIYFKSSYPAIAKVFVTKAQAVGWEVFYRPELERPDSVFIQLEGPTILPIDRISVSKKFFIYDGYDEGLDLFSFLYDKSVAALISEYGFPFHSLKEVLVSLDKGTQIVCASQLDAELLRMQMGKAYKGTDLYYLDSYDYGVILQLLRKHVELKQLFDVNDSLRGGMLSLKSVFKKYHIYHRFQSLIGWKGIFYTLFPRNYPILDMKPASGYDSGFSLLGAISYAKIMKRAFLSNHYERLDPRSDFFSGRFGENQLYLSFFLPFHWEGLLPKPMEWEPLNKGLGPLYLEPDLVEKTIHLYRSRLDPTPGSDNMSLQELNLEGDFIAEGLRCLRLKSSRPNLGAFIFRFGNRLVFIEKNFEQYGFYQLKDPS